MLKKKLKNSKHPRVLEIGAKDRYEFVALSRCRKLVEAGDLLRRPEGRYRIRCSQDACQESRQTT